MLNTRLEVSMPGFMKIDYLNQIRKEEKIGGGGCAIIYRGVILDSSLKEVYFFLSFFLFFFFFFFEYQNGIIKKFGCEEVALKEVQDEITFTTEENTIRFEQEVAIMWGISSHPNIITLIGYSDSPRCIITKVIFSFFIFKKLLLNSKSKNQNSCIKQIWQHLLKVTQMRF